MCLNLVTAAAKNIKTKEMFCRDPLRRQNFAIRIRITVEILKAIYLIKAEKRTCKRPVNSITERKQTII